MPNSQGFNVSQSAWAIDAVENFETSQIYTAGTANSGAAGELQNDYTIVHGNSRFLNEYALTCSNYGITWDGGNPSFNPPSYSKGTGVQIGYITSSSTSSLPGTGTYRSGSEWQEQIGQPPGAPYASFTLSAWIRPIAVDPAPVTPPSNPPGTDSMPYIVDWPIFYFGRTNLITSFPTTESTSAPNGSLACSGSIYLGLVPSNVGLASSPGNPWMTDRYRIGAYVNWKSVETGIPQPATEIADKAYSEIYDTPSATGSDCGTHIVMVYDPYESGSVFGSDTRPGSERLKIYVNGAQINLTFPVGNPYTGESFGPGPITSSSPVVYRRRVEIGNMCSIGNAKRSAEFLFQPTPFIGPGFGAPPPSGSQLHIFNGSIDEPSVWSKALSSAEILELYAAGHISNLENLTFFDSLVSWWRNGDTSADTPGSLATGIIKDIGPFSADAANITDMVTGVEASASIGIDSGSIIFSDSCLPGTLADAKSSPLYNRKQTLKSVYSVVDPHGVNIPERDSEITNLRVRWENIAGCSPPYLDEAPLGSIEPYGGSALWEADRLAGAGNPFVSSPRSPFYDSYDDYAVDTKYVFKAGTIIPEFRISDHIKKYAENDDFLIDQDNDFSIFGIPTGSSTSPQNSSEINFNEFYSNSEFMQFFDVVKTDHQGVAIPSEITIKCNALKKFIPYDGFYPSERSLQIASQFSESYSEFIEAVGGTDSDVADATSRPIMAAMFSPGILYNSIKAGIAVDYPVAIDSVSKFEYTSFVSGSTELTSSGYWALGTGSSGLGGWDYRIPFEALLEPEEYLQDKAISDMEPDPSCSLGLVTKLGQTGDNLYKLMMNNFLAEIPEFFLRNDEFTAIRSIPDNSKDFGKVEAGKTYGMRVKMRRSMNTTRRWYHPIAPAEQSTGLETITGYELPQDPIYQPELRETFTMYSRPSAFGPPVAAVGTLYNPTTGSFGGGVGSNSRQSWSLYSCSLGQQNQDLYPSDSLSGYNPSFTPPYYNGEAWADILYTAPATVTGNVSLDDILNNSKIIYWRIDGAPILKFKYRGKNMEESFLDFVGTVGPTLPYPITSQAYQTWAPATTGTFFPSIGSSSYDPGDSGTGWHFWGASSVWNGSGSFPMAPLHANKFAMQLSASINLLGREDVLVEDSAPDGKLTQKSTVNLSGRWVIQPKFETPMFNFGDQSIRPISSASNTLTIPTHGSESVPRGMWHQFGCTPRPNEGIFLEVADIPENWINFRGAYTGSERAQRQGVIGGSSLVEQGSYQSEHYDDYGSGNGVSSLMGVAGFTQVGDRTDSKSLDFGLNQKKISKKLGQLKQKKTVGEAIVAIPFYLEEGNQKLFSIDKNKIRAILEQQAGTLSITEDAEIGQSMFDLVAKMQKYVLPPRYDFVNNPEILNSAIIGAFAMYIFEFEHTFDAEDLSYIWQNVQPNAGLKSVFGEPQVESSITHSLTKNELLDAEDFDKEIRWHVFKVKQRASKNYFEKTTANKLGKSSINLAVQDTSAPSYNWPYDFFSLIELGNMSTQVALKNSSPASTDAEIDLQAFIPKFNYKENE
jgi:hypothetical protein